MRNTPGLILHLHSITTFLSLANQDRGMIKPKYVVDKRIQLHSFLPSAINFVLRSDTVHRSLLITLCYTVSKDGHS